MKVKINQNISIYLDTDLGRKLFNFQKDDIHELIINSAEYMCAKQYASRYEEKSIVSGNIENKAITGGQIQNKGEFDDVEGMKDYLRKKGIKFHPSVGKKKLLKLIEENK